MGDVVESAVSAGAEVFGGDAADVDDFFGKAKEVLGGDSGDLLGKASKVFGVDADDVFSGAGKILGDDVTDAVSKAGKAFGVDADDVTAAAGEYFGGGAAATGGGVAGGAGETGGGFGGILNNLIGDAVGAGGGGEGGEGGAGWSQYLVKAAQGALDDAPDVPMIRDLQDGDWTTIASSLPGLGGAMSSLGVTSAGIDEHIQNVGLRAVDDGSAWSFGSALVDRGTQFMQEVAAPATGDHVWTAMAEHAGVETPAWGLNPMNPFTGPGAGDVVDMRTYIQDPGQDALRPPMPTVEPTSPSVDETTGEQFGGAVDSNRFDAPDVPAANVLAQEASATYDEFDAPDAVQETDMQPMAAPPPVVEEEAPPPPPEPVADVADQMEDDLGNLSDDAFG